MVCPNLLFVFAGAQIFRQRGGVDIDFTRYGQEF